MASTGLNSIFLPIGKNKGKPNTPTFASYPMIKPAGKPKSHSRINQIHLIALPSPLRVAANAETAPCEFIALLRLQHGRSPLCPQGGAIRGHFTTDTV